MSASDRNNAVWHKSSYSNGSGNECVEVAKLRPGPALRDSKDPEGGALRLAPNAWTALARDFVTPSGPAGR